MQKVVLATGNVGKVRELASLLSDFGLDIVAQTDLGVDSAEETGLTFIENAILKARHAAKVTALPAIADDSGLAVDVLGGAPGIYSARYSGEDATDQKNLQKLLETMKDVPDDQRQARFHCVLVYLRHAEDPTPLVCHGSWPGVITVSVPWVMTKPSVLSQSVLIFFASVSQTLSFMSWEPIFTTCSPLTFAMSFSCGTALTRFSTPTLPTV